MLIIEWDGSLEIGHQLIDEQHKNLVNIINRLHALKVSGGGLEGMRRLLMELYNYSLYHFKEEEALMDKMDRTLRDIHIQEHEQFILTLDEIAENVNSGDTSMGTPMLRWLVGWLLDHISVTDKQLVACLKVP